MKFSVFFIALTVMVALTSAAVIKPAEKSCDKPAHSGSGVNPKPKCNVKIADQVVRKAFIRLYCYEKRVNKGKLDALWFLKKYFNKNKTNKGFLPRSALRESLRNALPKSAKYLRRRLNRLR